MTLAIKNEKKRNIRIFRVVIAKKKFKLYTFVKVLCHIYIIYMYNTAHDEGRKLKVQRASLLYFLIFPAKKKFYKIFKYISKNLPLQAIY